MGGKPMGSTYRSKVHAHRHRHRRDCPNVLGMTPIRRPTETDGNLGRRKIVGNRDKLDRHINFGTSISLLFRNRLSGHEALLEPRSHQPAVVRNCRRHVIAQNAEQHRQHCPLPGITT